MSSLYRIAFKYAHAIALRLELLAELNRLKRQEGCKIFREAVEVLRQPARVDDAILIRRFVDHRKKVLIVDIGANVGEWAEKMMRFLPNSEVLAFEPDHKSYEEFLVRFRTRKNVRIHNVGLSSAPGRAVLHLASDSRHSSLSALGADQEKGRELIRLETLDLHSAEILDLRKRVEFAILKIDVQGHELQVLHGAEAMLRNFDLIYLECTFARNIINGSKPSFALACSHLSHFGFHPVLLRDFGRTSSPYAIERDVLFVQEASTASVWGF